MDVRLVTHAHAEAPWGGAEASVLLICGDAGGMAVLWAPGV